MVSDFTAGGSATGAPAMRDGLARRIIDAVTAADRQGIGRVELRELLKIPPDSDAFRSALGHLVNRGRVVRRGAARRSLYYISDAVADTATRLPAALAPVAHPVSPAPLPPRRPGWESIHRTLAQPPARVPAPAGGVVWPDHVQVQRLPSPPAHSRYHVPPEVAAAAPGSFTSEWARLRAGGSRRA